MFSLAFNGSYKRSLTRTVWPIFSLMNVFFALKGPKHFVTVEKKKKKKKKKKKFIYLVIG